MRAREWDLVRSGRWIDSDQLTVIVEGLGKVACPLERRRHAQVNMAATLATIVDWLELVRVEKEQLIAPVVNFRDYHRPANAVAVNAAVGIRLWGAVLLIRPRP